MLNLDELLIEILMAAQEVLSFQHCAVALLEPSREELTVRAALGYDEGVTKGLRIRLGEGITGRVAQTGKPLLVQDVTKDPNYIPGIVGGKCEMAVPLMARDHVIGVLDAEAENENAFGEYELELFGTFASQVATALKNAELFQAAEEANTALRENRREIERMNQELQEYSTRIAETNQQLERKVHDLTTLHQAGRAITSSLDLDDTLEAIVGMAQEIVANTFGAIKLLDEESEEFEVRAAYLPATGKVMRTMTGKLDEQVLKENLKSFLGVPLKIGDRVIGMFEMGSSDKDVFGAEEQQLLQTLASQAAIAIENASLFERTQRTYFETIRSLAQALEARDSYTRGHSERVTTYATLCAAEMGLDHHVVSVLGYAGLLHDIGKIGISDAILQKPAALDADERKAIENHPLFGENIIGPIRFLRDAQLAVLHHHEWYDGSGYPAGIVGEAIPITARIIGVADAFDAMTSKRPYRDALTVEEAHKRLVEQRGTQFDPRVVEAFTRLIGRGLIPGEIKID
ncbi:MAG: HD domain-containing phosphohydrolase [Pseudomonadota bacterium]